MRDSQTGLQAGLQRDHKGQVSSVFSSADPKRAAARNFLGEHPQYIEVV
jgi:hypothetical protein